jgi:hypothetical protein
LKCAGCDIIGEELFVDDVNHGWNEGLDYFGVGDKGINIPCEIMSFFDCCGIFWRTLLTAGEIEEAVKILDTGFQICVNFVSADVFHCRRARHHDRQAIWQPRLRCQTQKIVRLANKDE